MAGEGQLEGLGRGPSLGERFQRSSASYWGNLSHFNNLLIVLNISMFFLTGLIERGYFYTFISLGFLAVVGVTILVPTPWSHRLGYYLGVLALELIALYFLLSSIVYWVRHGSMQMPLM